MTFSGDMSLRRAWRKFVALNYGPVKTVIDIARIAELSLTRKYPDLDEEMISGLTLRLTEEMVRTAGAFMKDLDAKIAEAKSSLPVNL